MPTLTKAYTLTITPEQFLDACSQTDLIELDMLLNSPRYRAKMNPEGLFPDSLSAKEDPHQLRIPDA